MDRRAWLRFRNNRGALFGLLIVVVITLFSIVGPWISPHNPFEPHFENGRQAFAIPVGPNGTFWFGTDPIFRDVFTRMAYGGRFSLKIAIISTSIAIFVGTVVGVVSGYFKGARIHLDRILFLAATATSSLSFALNAKQRASAWMFACILVAASAFFRLVAQLVSSHGRSDVRTNGRPRVVALALDSITVILSITTLSQSQLRPRIALVFVVLLISSAIVERLLWRYRDESYWMHIDTDSIIMRAVDVLLSFPFLLLLMSLGSLVEHVTESTIYLVLGLTSWTGAARVIRAKALQAREYDFVLAARGLGQSTLKILLKHITPQVLGSATLLATNTVASMIVAEAALSFLGMGVPPPAPSWGRMLDEGRGYFSIAPWLLFAPGSAIVLAVLGFNLLGEGLRDALDPKSP